MIDEHPCYPRIGRHEPVNHSADGWGHGAAHTSTSEGFLSIFKRGMRGVDQRCGERRVHPYLAEFDFRYNSSLLYVSDSERADRALAGVKGKRLRYTDSL
jgi:hypothetical protein